MKKFICPAVEPPARGRYPPGKSARNFRDLYQWCRSGAGGPACTCNQETGIPECGWDGPFHGDTYDFEALSAAYPCLNCLCVDATTYKQRGFEGNTFPLGHHHILGDLLPKHREVPPKNSRFAQAAFKIDDHRYAVTVTTGAGPSREISESTRIAQIPPQASGVVTTGDQYLRSNDFLQAARRAQARNDRETLLRNTYLPSGRWPPRSRFSPRKGPSNQKEKKYSNQEPLSNQPWIVPASDTSGTSQEHPVLNSTTDQVSPPMRFVSSSLSPEARTNSRMGSPALSPSPEDRLISKGGGPGWQRIASQLGSIRTIPMLGPPSSPVAWRASSHSRSPEQALPRSRSNGLARANLAAGNMMHEAAGMEVEPALSSNAGAQSVVEDNIHDSADNTDTPRGNMIYSPHWTDRIFGHPGNL
jgi:hypothetical protein